MTGLSIALVVSGSTRRCCWEKTGGVWDVLGRGALCKTVRYTSAGAEVDLVLEGEFGLIPVEIKYGQKVSLRSLRGIQGFINDFNCSYGIVVSNTERLALIDENLISIPFGYV